MYCQVEKYSPDVPSCINEEYDIGDLVSLFANLVDYDTVTAGEIEANLPNGFYVPVFMTMVKAT